LKGARVIGEGTLEMSPSYDSVASRRESGKKKSRRESDGRRGKENGTLKDERK